MLERHFAQVGNDREVALAEKTPTFSETLQPAAVIDVSQSRMMQELTDPRSACEQARQSAPTEEQVDELISGVRKITSTVR